MAYSQASAAVRTRLFGRLALLLLAVGGVILSLGALADLLLRQGWPVSPSVVAMLDPVHDEGLLGDWSTLQLLALAAFLCWCALERAGLRLPALAMGIVALDETFELHARLAGPDGGTPELRLTILAGMGLLVLLLLLFGTDLRDRRARRLSIGLAGFVLMLGTATFLPDLLAALLTRPTPLSLGEETLEAALVSLGLAWTLANGTTLRVVPIRYHARPPAVHPRPAL